MCPVHLRAGTRDPHASLDCTNATAIQCHMANIASRTRAQEQATYLFIFLLFGFAPCVGGAGQAQATDGLPVEVGCTDVGRCDG